jgi:hypothetical protein
MVAIPISTHCTKEMHGNCNGTRLTCGCPDCHFTCLRCHKDCRRLYGDSLVCATCYITQTRGIKVARCEHDGCIAISAYCDLRFREDGYLCTRHHEERGHGRGRPL